MLCLVPQVSFYNTFRQAFTVAQQLFPKGQAVAIIEPFYKVAADGTRMVRVDNPAEVRAGAAGGLGAAEQQCMRCDVCCSAWLRMHLLVCVAVSFCCSALMVLCRRVCQEDCLMQAETKPGSAVTTSTNPNIWPSLPGLTT